MRWSKGQIGPIRDRLARINSEKIAHGEGAGYHVVEGQIPPVEAEHEGPQGCGRQRARAQSITAHPSNSHTLRCRKT